MHRSRIEFPKLFKEIQVMGIQEQGFVKSRGEWRDKALDLLHEKAFSSEDISDRIKMITQRDSGIRCAMPTQERIDEGITLTDGCSQPVTIVAADASQISPSDGEEEDLDFGLINIGLFRWPAGGQGTEEICLTHILHHDDLFRGNIWAMDAPLFRLRRDAGERIALIEQVMKETNLTIGLVDGPIELFREPGNTAESRVISNQYFNTLRRLSEVNQIIAGYIDNPKANMVVQMLELAILGENNLQDARNFHPFGRLRDRMLFQNILPPGSRSAIFQIQSSTTKYYSGDITPHFFYLNVSPMSCPKLKAIARVDIPRWVAINPILVDSLHAALLSQCRYTGKPYPYSLIRAHEICVISRDDTSYIERAIGDTYQSLGIPTEYRSFKSELKGILG